MDDISYINVCGNYPIGDIMEVEVLERAICLWNELPRRMSKEQCVKKAINDLQAERYIEDNARMFDITIEEARVDFEKNILSKMAILI